MSGAAQLSWSACSLSFLPLPQLVAFKTRPLEPWAETEQSIGIVVLAGAKFLDLYGTVDPPPTSIGCDALWLWSSPCPQGHAMVSTYLIRKAVSLMAPKLLPLDSRSPVRYLPFLASVLLDIWVASSSYCCCCC